MKNLLLVVFVFISFIGQTQSYFQQEVNYTIHVELDDESHYLRGDESFEYINNSPDVLSEIYIHLWPNAYINNRTALGKQLYYNMEDESLEYAYYKEEGFIDSLAFKVDGTPVEYAYVGEHLDICRIELPQPLNPGGHVIIETPFIVKIPSGSISRLGHVGESYQITQWYPKPAVYDQNGWHPMPYLTQGEFYSEFGSFDVSITLPENYVVGATGDLQTESEIEFLDRKAEEKVSNTEDADFPTSSKTMKTIRYTQKNVHDFAWFADKRYAVLKGEAKLPDSDRTVTSWAMYVPTNHDQWQHAIEYLNDAIYYYSKWNGEYPYNQVTAVDGTISAGGGMEYPNVTVIGQTESKEELEVVIVHEVGHNWFYGLLGSNERDHAWMDEGLNTLNEIRYMETKYPNNTFMSDMANGVVGKVHFEEMGHHDMHDLTYQVSVGYGEDQPIETHSADFTSLNYGAIVYAKTGLTFTYLKDYLGEEEFDRVMQKYYADWHYKHPQPEDLRKTFEQETEKDLSWVFDDLIQTTKQLDYKIVRVKEDGTKTKVKVKNVGHIEGPIPVDAMSLGKVRETAWIEPGNKSGEVTFKGTSYDQFVIDSKQHIPETNRNNNYWKKKGLFHRVEPFKMEIGIGDNEGEHWNHFWLPAMGYNIYDQFMLGLLFHNQTVPKHKLEYTLIPMFSFGRKNVSGTADMNYMWTPPKGVKRTVLGIRGQTFGTGLGWNPDLSAIPNAYWTVQPYLELSLGKPTTRKFYDQTVLLKGSYVSENGAEMENNLIGGFLEYTFNWSKGRNAFDANVRVDYVDAQNQFAAVTTNSQLANLGISVAYELDYWAERNKSLSLRLFSGNNLFYSGTKNDRYGFALGGQSGTQDYFYERFMIGRNATDGIWEHQRLANHGGFKTVHDYGTTTTRLFTVNFAIELPYVPFVGLYADYGLFDEANTMVGVAAAGIQLKVSNRMGIYFPLYESESLKSSYPDGTEYGQKIRLTYDINGFSLRNILSNAL